MSFEPLLARAVVANNARIRATPGGQPGFRDVESVAWHHSLVSRLGDIQREWQAFAERGDRLPRIEQILGESQGNVGAWRVGLLVSRGRPIEPFASLFPTTITALSQVVGLRSALWSVLEPGTELPAHDGPNAGVLRYHLGVSCPDGAAIEIGGASTPMHDGTAVLFDDTATHSAWNHGDRDRVTLFCELIRPLSGVNGFRNRLVQEILSLDRRYRLAPARAAEWHRTHSTHDRR